MSVPLHSPLFYPGGHLQLEQRLSAVLLSSHLSTLHLPVPEVFLWPQVQAWPGNRADQKCWGAHVLRTTLDLWGKGGKESITSILAPTGKALQCVLECPVGPQQGAGLLAITETCPQCSFFLPFPFPVSRLHFFTMLLGTTTQINHLLQIVVSGFVFEGIPAQTLVEWWTSLCLTFVSD